MSQPHRISNSEMIRVSPRQPCPICEKDHWCYFIWDMTAVVCMRVESDRPTKSGEGFLHILKETKRDYTHPIFTPSKDPPQRAHPDTLNRVYREFHAELRLSATHRQHLIEARNLTPEEIHHLGYKTLPAPDALSERAPIVNLLVERHGRQLLTVPGFYLTDSGRIWLSGAGGLAIPCKDVDGNIVGYQIRIDGATENKYRWLSAPKRKRKRGGVSSGTPIHMAGREYQSKRAWITEGIIKADITALRLGETVIGVAGVGAWNREELQETLQKLDVESVIIAFDADMKKNKHVEKALRKLAQACLSMGYRVFIAEWDIKQGKGIDDLRVNGHQPTIRRYHPQVNVDDLKSIGGEQRVRRVVAPHAIPHQQIDDIDDLRQQMWHRIEDFARHADGGALLVKGTQGLSKSTGAVDIVDNLWQNGQLRPVYATPRHDLVEALIPQTWVHIHPRKPRQSDMQQMNSEEAYRYITAMTGTPDINDLLIRCAHWKRADAIANKRWNVVKDLCLTDCLIGQTLGTDGCPYFMQYRSDQPLATVHETLFIPKFCDEIFGNPQLKLHQMSRQVCIIDEPNPSKFYETVDITPDDLSRAIVDAWDPNLKQLLDLVRRTAENVASRLTDNPIKNGETVPLPTVGHFTVGHSMKRKIIGRDVMQELVDFAGGAEKLEKLLVDAKAEAPSKHEKVIVGIDTFVDITKKSYKVIINGQTRFIPQALADPIDGESMKMVKGYALKENFPILASFEQDSDGDIPLNFCTDLLWALNREFQLYQVALNPDSIGGGTAYNSALVFTVKSGTPIVRLNLRKEIAVPQDVPLILLDAQGNADLLSRLLGRDVETWEAAISPDTEITQLVDGSYGITSLWNRQTKAPKSSLKRLLNRVVFPLVKPNPKDALIITWKKVADYLRRLQDEGHLSRAMGIEHYGNIEGSNEHEHRKTVILLGTPQVSPDELEEMAHALFQNDGAPISMETSQRWERYNYQDSNGHGYEVKARRYVDERVELLSRLFKEDEIVQAAHRVRPLLHKGKQIYLLTNLPLDELPPTRLVTIKELSASVGTPLKGVDSHGKMTREFFDDVAIQFQVENDNRISVKTLKPALQQTFVKMAIKDSYGEIDERQSQRGFPSDSTLERWLKDLAYREGWERSKVTVERRGKEQGGGATWLYVYHEGELDEAAVRADYAEQMGIGGDDVVLIEPCPWADADGDDVIDFPKPRQARGQPPPPGENPEREREVFFI